MGVRVGRDEGCTIRLASHDDHPYSRFTCPSLTTAAHDYESVSDHAVETLFQLIEAGGQLENREETLFAARLIMRGSA
jgi:DNA-binding LacI/PurR family transcriptional regulator